MNHEPRNIHDYSERQGAKEFQLVTDVDLGDGESPVVVDVEFLAPSDVKLEKHRPKLLPGFRVLQRSSCKAAFRAPVGVPIKGQMIRGASNQVNVRVASLADCLVMKALALGGRDKPKDAYDLCYVLDHSPQGMEGLASEWRAMLDRPLPLVREAVELLKQKFDSPQSFGPQQVVEFHDSQDPEERDTQARRAFELVRKFMEMLE